MNDLSFYIILLVSIPILNVFAIRRQEKVIKVVNKKRRYGVFLTAVLFSIPLFLFIVMFNNVEVISLFTAIDIRIVTILIFLLLVIIFVICNKFLYIVDNYSRYEKEKSFRKQSFKNWSYYIIKYPASSIRNMMKMPPVSKYSKPDPKLFKEYHLNSLNTPPAHIQFILILIIYVFTSFGFFISDYIMGDWAVIYTNLYILPFVLLMTFMNGFIFGMIRFMEYIFKKNINEIVQVLLFCMIYVLVIDGIWLMIK
ncbi:hypothetical protein [Vallitalea guaymasensis]|uniref:hypothetical protein n=1 Tax=Vallitalea guaymasensis TaxID=1185412 RepID=UPI000DE23F77|nr:hypothetical protein [Vallitalea guaymasensis]